MSSASKRPIGINVFDAAVARTAWALDNFPRVYVSFSGGKDSSVMLHMTATIARERGRKIGVLCVDLEAQYKLTIDHIREMYTLYADVIEPYWVAVPLNLRNAVSAYEPQWCCWEPGRDADWVRQPDPSSITDCKQFPFYHHRMEFEEFVPAFGDWYGGGKMCACLVGIRTDESLNRWRTIAGGKKASFGGRQWTTMVSPTLVNIYPVYDWKTADIWTFHGKTGLIHNALYDRMHLAGLTPPDEDMPTLRRRSTARPVAIPRHRARDLGARRGPRQRRECRRDVRPGVWQHHGQPQG